MLFQKCWNRVNSSLSYSFGNKDTLEATQKKSDAFRSTVLAKHNFWRIIEHIGVNSSVIEVVRNSANRLCVIVSFPSCSRASKTFSAFQCSVGDICCYLLPYRVKKVCILARIWQLVRKKTISILTKMFGIQGIDLYWGNRPLGEFIVASFPTFVWVVMSGEFGSKPRNE